MWNKRKSIFKSFIHGNFRGACTRDDPTKKSHLTYFSVGPFPAETKLLLWRSLPTEAANVVWLLICMNCGIIVGIMKVIVIMIICNPFSFFCNKFGTICNKWESFMNILYVIMYHEFKHPCVFFLLFWWSRLESQKCWQLVLCTLVSLEWLCLSLFHRGNHVFVNMPPWIWVIRVGMT